jgi:hypothetical protein
MEQIKSLKVYILMGKVICGLAGGILGFFAGGPLLVIPGVLLGVLAGYLFKNSIISKAS